MRNLTSRWRRPDTKNRTAKITIINRTAGLILAPEDGDGDEGVDGGEDEGEIGGGYSIKPSIWVIWG